MPQHTETNQAISCLNCGNLFSGHFCNACGQDAHTGRIDRHFVYHELQHALFHIDKGILYTLRMLFAAPGRTIRSFIGGQRVRHFKPLMFLVVTTGLYAFVNHFFKHLVIVTRPTGSRAADNSVQLVNEYLIEYYEWFVLLQLPLIAGMYYLFFRKYGTNFVEQLVVCAYVTGMRTLLGILILPLNAYLPAAGYVLESAMPVALFIWTYLQFYNGRPKGAIVWRTLLGYVCYYLLLLVLLSVLLTVFGSVA